MTTMVDAAPLRLVADANIIHAETFFGPFGKVVLSPGADISPALIRDADALLVRSVTPVGPDLLRGSAVRFVGTATIGTDHIDLEYLAAEGISFAHAPGSNAESVVEYVLAALLALSAERDEPLRGKTVGVVGCGQIGSRLAARLPALGARVLRNDPPLAAAGGGRHPYLPLSGLLDAADVVTLHPPLTRTGPHPTHHLIGVAELARMRPGAWLVNASRGGVVDSAALQGALEGGGLGAAIIDVWEGEPDVPPPFIGRAALATPHIAGYSYDGKLRGTLMLAESLAAWRGTPAPPPPSGLGPPPPALRTPPPDLPEHVWLDALVRQAYDVRADDARLRALLPLPAAERVAGFTRLRKTYPPRRRFGLHRVAGAPEVYRHAVTEGLGMAWGGG